MAEPVKPRLAVLAGGGHLPVETAHAARRAGHEVLVVAIADEADLSSLDTDITTDRVEWGQVGRLMQALADFNAQKLVIIGGISRRPDYTALRLDWGAVQLLPRILNIVLGGGDAAVLDKVASLFSDRGFRLVGAHEVAPGLVVGQGHVAGPRSTGTLRADLLLAARAAWTAGHLDMGQGAVAVAGRVVAVEGAEGTDGLLERVSDMRQARRFSARGRVGVLAKCPRPGQDLRLDMPAIGPRTIALAAQAGLSAILVEAGRVLVSQRAATQAACVEHNVSLIGEDRALFIPDGRVDACA